MRKGKYHSISTSACNDINVDDSLVLSKCSEDIDNEDSDVTESSESDHSDIETSGNYFSVEVSL